ncbi:MAG: hypothetical protein H6837_16240 [Planctomycetes bacterium]|nr:hypothetical protein [Planctomycetota bacterium]
MQRLESFLARHTAVGADGVLEDSGAFAFQLHDTYGFPVDITRQVIHDRGARLDEEGFEQAMAGQRERARAGSATADAVFAGNAATALAAAKVPPSEFCGYEALEAQSEVCALVGQDNVLLDRAGPGDAVLLVTATTPFYATGGGQTGDRGEVVFSGGRAVVSTTTHQGVFHLHHATVEVGVLEPGTAVTMRVDQAARRATERHHTATHLLHRALRDELGEHVNQAGSVVEPERLRFDFTHPEKLSDEQLRRIEEAVNAQIMQATEVVARVCGKAQAQADGFVALFGEKYGDQVRTLSVGTYSKELCGGTHVANSGAIGCFRIVTETAISAGTRRIEAVAGTAALAVAQKERDALEQMARLLKAPVAELPERVSGLLGETKQLRKELEKATAADLGQVLEALAGAATEGESGRSVVLQCQGLGAKDLTDLFHRVQQTMAPIAAVVVSPGADGVLVGATVSPALTSKIRAGDLVRELTQCMGGGGGGRPEAAQGKGKDASKLPAALAKARELLGAAGLGAAP